MLYLAGSNVCAQSGLGTVFCCDVTSSGGSGDVEVRILAGGEATRKVSGSTLGVWNVAAPARGTSGSDMAGSAGVRYSGEDGEGVESPASAHAAKEASSFLNVDKMEEGGVEEGGTRQGLRGKRRRAVEQGPMRVDE